jgi:hydrogenase maturation protein HypF
MSVPLGVADDSMGLAVGGELKNTVAVVREGNAILSQHLGDLNHPLALEYFARAMADMQDLFGVRPAWIAHDLHPLYQSRLHGVRLASKLGAALIGVQHHHAHAASLMAEHGVCEPILAIVCDGVGYGQDGTSWGGELLHCDLTRFERLGHLSPLLLPGGDAAAKDTRRCGLALMRQSLGDSFADHPLATRLVPDGDERQFLCQMLGKGVNCAASSGAGRVFDGIAALLGVGTYNDFEAQSAMAIEACAASWEGPVCSDALFAVDDHLGIDLSPLYRRLIAQTLDDPGRPAALAALFHEQFALAWEAAVLRASQHTGIRTVGLSGGCFCNEILTKRLTQLLDRRGLRVLRHQVVGPNDGGIALGQAAVAMARRKAGA